MIPKVHYQDDSEELLRLADGRMNTLIEEVGVKLASSSAFPPEVIGRHLPDKDHFLQHVIAMGDGETYGPNKNGDFWPKLANQTYHDTFVTNGTFFREHRNRDAKTQGIGHIKASAYNPDMNRIELLVWGNKKKAEEEYQMAKEGKTLSYSMAARVPNDKCSICGNVAPSRFQYCSHLKEGMLKYFDSHEKYAFAINDHPTYFDISRVKAPADRIAHFIEYQFPGEKVASDGLVVSGAQWAEFEGLVGDSSGPSVIDAQKYGILKKLAAEEVWWDSAINDPSPKSEFAKTARDSWHSDLNDEQLEVLGRVDLGSLFHKLAEYKVLLPFPSFAALTYGKTIKEAKEDQNVKEACSILPEIFTKLLSNSSSCGMESMCDAGTPLIRSYHGGGPGDLVQDVMDQIEDRVSIDNEPVKGRAMMIVFKSASEELTPSEGPTSATAEGLARAYGHYKVSALTDMVKLHGNEFLDDAKYLVAVAQNRVYG